MNWFKLLLAGLLLICLCAGCSTVTDWWHDHGDDLNPVTPTTTTTTTTIPPAPEGANAFLWKPVSDSRDGRAAVLLPCRYRQEDVHHIEINGDESEVAERRPGYANLNRPHWFLKKTGAEYGLNIRVEAIGMDGAVTGAWLVRDGSQRDDGR